LTGWRFILPGLVSSAAADCDPLLRSGFFPFGLQPIIRQPAFSDAAHFS
jgi:hypothetical protein